MIKWQYRKICCVPIQTEWEEIKKHFSTELIIFKNKSNKVVKYLHDKFKQRHCLKDKGRDIKSWKDNPHSWMGRNNTNKIAILHKAIHRFKATLGKL